jgi:hypothetical protein
MPYGLRRPLQASLVDPSLDVPVDCGEAGEWETVEAAVAQGAHRSAALPESSGLVKEEVAYQVQAGNADCATATSRKEIHAILRKARVQLKRFRSIVGRLQHATRILPTARVFFTPL